MSIAVLSRMAPRGLILAAAASAALVIGGCTQEQQPGNGATASSSSPQAMRASSSEGQPQAGSSSESRAAMAFPTGNRSSSDLLVEQIGPRQVRVGQPYAYQLRVTNLTDQTLTGVVLHERVPSDFKLASNDARHEGENGQARFDVGDLGPKQSKTFQVSGTPSKPGTLDTCLSAQYNPPTLCSHIAVVAPAIKAVAEGPSESDVCQDLDYRYTVTNTGTGTAHNVVLQANLPEGLTTADGQRTLTAKVGELAQGQSKTVNARLRATQAGHFTSEATVRSDAGDVQTQQIATDVRAPRLAVTISGPKEAYMGQQVAYQVTVTNKGDAAAQATRVRLGATPGHVQFVNATGADGSQLAAEREGGGQDLGNLAPGESRSMTVNFNVVQNGAIAVDATAAAKCAADVTTYANTNVAALTASTLEVSHDPDPVAVGSNVTYHITLINKGNAPDHNVRVSAMLPDSEQYVSADGQTKASNDGRQITFGPIDTLQPKQRVTWQVTAKALKPDLAQFKANMVSQATPQAAAKVEPTKLYSVQNGNETRTREAPAPQRTNENAPAPAPGQLNK
jgi:uncharacterized repeat protein (TIGR01451 family)